MRKGYALHGCKVKHKLNWSYRKMTYPGRNYCGLKYFFSLSLSFPFVNHLHLSSRRLWQIPMEVLDNQFQPLTKRPLTLYFPMPITLMNRRQSGFGADVGRFRFFRLCPALQTRNEEEHQTTDGNHRSGQVETRVIRAEIILQAACHLKFESLCYHITWEETVYLFIR